MIEIDENESWVLQCMLKYSPHVKPVIYLHLSIDAYSNGLISNIKHFVQAKKGFLVLDRFSFDFLFLCYIMLFLFLFFIHNFCIFFVFSLVRRKRKFFCIEGVFLLRIGIWFDFLLMTWNAWTDCFIKGIILKHKTWRIQIKQGFRISVNNRSYSASRSRISVKLLFQ